MKKYDYEAIVAAINAAGISAARYCRENNLNYQSIKAGIRNMNKKNKIIKVMPIESPGLTKQKSIDIIVEFYGATLKASSDKELSTILEAIKNVQAGR